MVKDVETASSSTQYTSSTVYTDTYGLATKPTSKVTATRYYSFAGTTVAMREADGVHFLASDNQGTAQLAVDAKTGSTTRRRMDTFGNLRDDATSSSTGWVNDKGFVGGTVQASTGLTTLGAREYDSDTGRFISADPVIDYTDPQQINGYAYANNSPVSNSDASGMRLADCVGGWNECGPGPSTHRGAVDTRDSGGSGGTGSGTTYTPAQAQADNARAKEDSAKQRAIAIAKELGKIAMDELGITDALDCFTTGNLGACGNTALNVVGSFLGGGPLAKLAKKYLFRWDKAAALGKRIYGLGKDLLKTFKDWRKNSKMALSYEEAAAKANKALNSKLDDMHATMSRSKIRQYAMGSAAVDRRTGKVAVGLKKTGAGEFCAEDVCRAELVKQGADPEDIVYSVFQRPLKREPAPVCPRCESRTSRGQFAPGTTWESDLQ
ncbi:RHS repeat domain-containing protein [Streptomyces sp. R39]|uniref:RHS repeat domain-containing protein n=1 Tax=Streptomyces sp. R39 TaxID=3238631 RepID=A0AB39QUA2_9ACTN